MRKGLCFYCQFGEGALIVNSRPTGSIESKAALQKQKTKQAKCNLAGIHV